MAYPHHVVGLMAVDTLVLVCFGGIGLVVVDPLGDHSPLVLGRRDVWPVVVLVSWRGGSTGCGICFWGVGGAYGGLCVAPIGQLRV